MINLNALFELDKECLHYQVDFEGIDIIELANRLEANVWEFDYFLSEKLTEILGIVNYSHGLIVSFGRESGRVIYIQLIEAYPEIGGSKNRLFEQIKNLDWKADEIDMVTINNSEKLRIWWRSLHRRNFIC